MTTKQRTQTPWTATDIPLQHGRRALITGANSGIGFHTALELARKGAEIILPARTQAKAQDAVTRILQEVPSAHLFPEILDLADQSSIRTFARHILQTSDHNRSISWSIMPASWRYPGANSPSTDSNASLPPTISVPSPLLPC